MSIWGKRREKVDWQFYYYSYTYWVQGLAPPAGYYEETLPIVCDSGWLPLTQDLLIHRFLICQQAKARHPEKNKKQKNT